MLARPSPASMQGYYDPELGVWISVDKLSDQFPASSVYNFVEGKPTNLKDPDGNAPQGSKWTLGLNLKLSIGDSKVRTYLGPIVGYEYGNNDYSAMAFAGASFYSGDQFGTSKDVGSNFDFVLGGLLTRGSGSGEPHAVIGLGPSMKLPTLNTYDMSISWGMSAYYSVGLNKNGDGPGIQTVGFFGFRLGQNFSLMSYNDGSVFPYFAFPSTDGGPTGDINAQFGKYGLIEAGHNNYSGHRLEGQSLRGPGEYEQTDFQKGFN